MTKISSHIEYEKLTLEDSDVLDDPVQQLSRWWNDAIEHRVHLLDAVHLSTVDEHGHPDARIVLLKGFDEHGLVFYTNYESQKAVQLQHHRHACLIIFWPQVERQIRIRGSVEKTSRQESEAYFATRPRGAQLGAWASPQSRAIDEREQLEHLFQNMEARFKDQEIPCPPHWGGFRLTPNYFEFWQGRKNRLHDRISFALMSPGHWQKQRLAP